ncbi:MAG: class I SAM-dependent RNA methyltransferase [Deltaproteobacteria bacterium]|nr:class I SAM-dependent RNA methyltransferase [Deltaproteobacteria bacterium]
MLAIEIEKMVYGGKGLGRIGGKVVFVPFTAPGDRVQVEIRREKKDYAEALLKSVERASPLRTPPFCRFFGDCGGCHLQHIPYGKQLPIKEEILMESLGRLQKDGGFEIRPVLASPVDRAYRIRVQMKVKESNKIKKIGFYSLSSHNLVEVDQCPILHPPAGEILPALAAWLNSTGKGTDFSGVDLAIDPEEKRGVILLRAAGDFRPGMAAELGKGLPKLKGALIKGRHEESWGNPEISLRGPEGAGCGPLLFHLGHDSFFQVNPFQNRELIRLVVGWADLSGKESVLDLFCGAGNFSLPLAQRSARLWGVDFDRRAVQYAIRNARENGLSNCSFLPAGARVGVERLKKEGADLHLAVLDPPRVGAGEVLEALAGLRPKRILYVSCEPPTLVRDLARLRSLGYSLSRVQPLDMFPHTYHMEVVAELV